VLRYEKGSGNWGGRAETCHGIASCRLLEAQTTWRGVEVGRNSRGNPSEAFPRVDGSDGQR